MFSKSLMVIFIFILGFSGIAQEINNPDNQKYQVKSKRVIINESLNKYEYFGNVKFENETIRIIDAQQMTFNKTTNEIVAVGFSGFKFDGKIQISEGSKNNKLRYKLDESIAYLE